MDDPIIFTPAEMVQVILAVAGFIVAINAAIVVLASWWNKAHKPETIQNERLDALEKSVKMLEEEIPRMKDAYYKKSAELEEYEKDNKVFQRVMVHSLQALTEHAINGNNTDSLKSAVKELNDYLVDR